ncbi:MAG: glycosyltransferase [Chloroflexota bacterium]|nr:MAG: glycosyltransferase [Chloroflexota bacterium]
MGSVDSGGQNVYVAQVARHLARLGYAVDVFTRCDSEDLPDILKWEDGVRVIHVPAGPAAFVPKEELLPYMDEFTGFIHDFCKRQGNYDLIHANFWMSALIAADIKKAIGTPFLVTFHALGRVRRLYQGQEDGFPDIRFSIEDRIVLEADRIIAECPQDKEDLLTLYPADPSKISIIPCGFDPEELWPLDKALSRRVLGIPEDERVVLQLGRMVPRKGVDTVIRGFARMVNVYNLPGRLLVVGGESEEADPGRTPEIGRLMKIAEEEGVDSSVLFTGRRSREAIKHYFSAADIFVSTPWYEPFGITPLEAMACGTPVIGSNVGGIKYSVAHGETGYLVAPNDPGALAERLAHLYLNPAELEKFSQQAIQRVNRFFTWEKVAASISTVYEDILAQSPQPICSRNGVVAVRSNGKASTNPAAPAVVTGAILPTRKIADPSLIFDRSFDAAIAAMLQAQESLRESVLDAASAIVECLSRGGKVMVCGNGGSAADAQHFAAEFVGRLVVPNRKGLPVLPLTADSAFLTAWSNDVGYDHVFARQVETFGHPGDVLLGISTSGQSQNVIEAFQMARSMQMVCVALLGGDGGAMVALSNYPIIVPASNAQRIQEVQILILHMIAEIVEERWLAGEIITPPVIPTVAPGANSNWGMSTAIPIHLPGSGGKS